MTKAYNPAKSVETESPFMSGPEVDAIFPGSRATRRKDEAEGAFPSPISIHGRRNYYDRTAVMAWIAEKKADAERVSAERRKNKQRNKSSASTQPALA